MSKPQIMKFFSLTLSFFFLLNLVHAQHYFDETSSWNVLQGDGFDNWYEYSKYNVVGDTIIDNKTYHKLLCRRDYLQLEHGYEPPFDTSYYLPMNEGLIRYIREESSKIFLYTDTEEELLYDFDMEIGDTAGITWYTEIIVSVDSFLFNSSMRKKFTTNGGTVIFEGIGTTKGFLDGFPSLGDESFSSLICYAQGEDYLNPLTYQAEGIIAVDSCTSYIVSSTKTPVPEKNDIRYFPNPTSSSLFIELIGDEKMEKISILNYEGKLLIEIKCQQKNHTLDIQHLTKGFYILCIEINGTKEFRKIIKS